MNLVIVDIQPAYSEFIPQNLIHQLGTAVATADNVVWYYNGSDLGIKDTEWEILEMCGMENEFGTGKIEFIEKDYGFFRDFMDNGVCHDDIIFILKENDGFVECEEYGYMHDPDHKLPPFGNEFFHVCGGGSDECLAEMEIYFRYKGMENFKRLPMLVYG